MQPTIDFSPLATFSKLFLFFRMLRRVRMIAVRVVLAAGLIALIVGMIWTYNTAMQAASQASGDSSEETYEYSFSANGSLDGGTGLVIWLLIAALFAQWLLTLLTMSVAWDRFAKVNRFTQLPLTEPRTREIMKVPSFQGKPFAVSLGPIQGTHQGREFALHSRQYKEGGLLRWREKQMDTVLTMLLPATLPHIVINARSNEKARRSNLSKSFPADYKFQFEGSMGTRYDVYTKPESRVTALQLFTPDVLQVLYEKLPSADLELLGDKVWIVQRYGVLDDKLAKDMLKASHALYEELEKQLRVAGLLQPQPQISVQ